MERIRKNITGSTLIECIAAFALFSLASFILLSGFLTIGNLVVKSIEQKDITNNIINALETDTAQNGVTIDKTSSQNFSFKLGSVNYTSKGFYRYATNGDVKFTEFVPDVSGIVNSFIPYTDKPVNGSWPQPEDFEYWYSFVLLPEGTTFEYNGIYYITLYDVDIWSVFASPTNGLWLQSGNPFIAISSRDVIVWNGGTLQQFYNATGGRINKGDKVLWNGNYYVFTISNQTWANPPNISLSNWAIIKYPL